jgi:hypothetical protein
MSKSKILITTCLLSASLLLSGCLSVLEEVTLNKDGSGTYSLTLDMSAVKGFIEMAKEMAQDSSANKNEVPEIPNIQDASMTQLGEQLISVKTSLSGIAGISNVQETNDTTEFKFGYNFQFATVEALNRALRVINKEKYESKTGEVFKFDGKVFVRNADGDIGAQLQNALAENDEEGSSDMVKMFFSDFTYTQKYRFAEQKVKKNSNKSGSIDADEKVVTIELKPFGEQNPQNPATVATKIVVK